MSDDPKPDWVLVPREPTEAMCEAWSNASIGDYPLAGLSNEEANAIAAKFDWSAMLAAVPAPEVDRVAELEAEVARLRAALERIPRAVFLDISFAPHRSACAIARAALKPGEAA